MISLSPTASLNQPIIIGTGLSGLVGSKFVQLFGSNYALTNLDLTDPISPVDITNYDEVAAAFEKNAPAVAIHMAAFTNVNAAFEQTGDKSQSAWRVNVVGTENISKAAQANGTYLIHISTAYVFDGKKPEPYVETDKPNPIEWYGVTKHEAELRVLENPNSVIFRIDQPFRADTFAKPDTAHRIIAGIQAGTLFPQFADHHFGPTSIEDFSKVLDWAIRTKPTGLYHASSGESWSDFDFAQAINETLQLGGDIRPGSLTEYLKKSNRPYQRNTALNCQKLVSELDFQLMPIKTALSLLQY